MIDERDFFEERDGDEVEQDPPATGLTAEQLKEILASEREANEARMRQVLGGQTQRGVPLQVEETFPEINIDATGLPHPSHDIEGFLKGYGERTNKAMQTAMRDVVGRVRSEVAQTATTVSTQQGTVQQAFAMIREAAPEMDEDMIEFAAQKVANAYRARGIDPMTALSQDVVGVAQEVLTYADQRFGGAEQAPAPRSGANRTGGIRTGRGRVPRARAEPNDGGDMVADLKEFQQTARIY